MTAFAATFKTIGERTARAALKQEDHEHMPETNPKAARAVADGKPRPGLLEAHVRHQIAAVATHGADKYGTRNWRVHPVYIRTYVDAMLRHLDAWAEGEDLDPDSGHHHLAHIGANVNVVLDALKHGTLVDNRDFAESKPAGEAANVPTGTKPDPAASLTPLEALNAAESFCGECGVGGSHAVGCCNGDLEPVDAGVSKPGQCHGRDTVDCGGVPLTQDIVNARPGAYFRNFGPLIASPQPMCPSDQRPCPVRGGCMTPCQGV